MEEGGGSMLDMIITYFVILTFSICLNFILLAIIFKLRVKLEIEKMKEQNK